jgi:hypothetical protein
VSFKLGRVRDLATPQVRSLYDLLERWGRLEPERCRPTEDAFEVKLGPHWHLISAAASGLSRGALLAALHDALAEAELSWTLASHADGFTATLSPDAVAGPGRVTYSVTTYSEPMSLLWAYLELLAPTSGGLNA